MFPDGVNRMLSISALREQQFDDTDVANLWNKAMRNASDAKLPAMSLDGAIQSAYTAVFEASLALLAQQGLRTGSARNHHENTFAGVDAFQLSGLDDLIPDSSRIRSLRSSSMYDPDIAHETDRDDALRWLDETLPKMYAALVAWSPGLASDLAKP